MTRPPNVLLFLPDAMQARVVTPGHPCLTPAIDALAQRGLRFDRAYTVNPTCSPARASLMTGLLPHNHGVLEVEHGRDPDQCNLRADKPHFAQQLREAGYHTAYFGKWHIERSGELDRFGWAHHDVWGRHLLGTIARGVDDALDDPPDPALSYWMEHPPGYRRLLHHGVVDSPVDARPPGIITSRAMAHLDDVMGGEQPWCCCVSFAEPNEALVAGRDAFSRYDPASLPLPTTLRDDLAGRPGLYRRSQGVYRGLTDDQWRRAMACYYARITELDGQLHRLINLLASRGELERTVVIVASDHGRYVGAHGMDSHNFGAFEDIYRIPLVMAGPGVQSGVTHARVGLHELGLTLLDLAGAAPIEPADGRSFAPVLAKPDDVDGWREGYAEYHGTRFPLAQRIYWDGDWKLVFNGFDDDELYDLKHDPDELRNLAGDPTQAVRVERMMAGVWRRIRDTGDRTLLESHYYPMRFAAVGPEAAE